MCVCVRGGGGRTLRSVSPQQSERRRDERRGGRRDAACLQERNLNNRLRRSVAVTLAACVDAHGVLCCSVMHEGYRLCYPAVTPHILTSNQINSWVLGSGGAFEERQPQVSS